MPKERNWEEDKVEFAKKDDLNQSEKNSLEKWKKESETSLSETTINALRIGVSVLGILILIYSLFFLLAFTFDRITVTEWKAMPTITKDRLFVVEDKEDSTFNQKSYGQPKGISIADLVKIEFLLIGLSICLLNGWIYAIITAIIQGANSVQSYFSQLF
ncbi:hypothetical protein CN326_04085 [Bacillus sp. AFS018417]|uniref:hypothetical protein n=1 Tax=unclassified Bacillus (in: firmicutes) TaxID=185979 RepID=UPI000BF82745|nr:MULTISPECIES: hypothetical protein [unclassified Bacillus (in: firmicutes)]MCP1125730.1 hypothetical protein [Bacillus sp. 3103sda1]PEZ08859.1 hypothetical protein CN326_04085 [Bacillus sp. AFS018417]